VKYEYSAARNLGDVIWASESDFFNTEMQQHCKNRNEKLGMLFAWLHSRFLKFFSF